MPHDFNFVDRSSAWTLPVHWCPVSLVPPLCNKTRPRCRSISHLRFTMSLSNQTNDAQTTTLKKNLDSEPIIHVLHNHSTLINIENCVTNMETFRFISQLIHSSSRFFYVLFRSCFHLFPPPLLNIDRLPEDLILGIK